MACSDQSENGFVSGERRLHPFKCWSSLTRGGSDQWPARAAHVGGSRSQTARRGAIARRGVNLVMPHQGTSVRVVERPPLDMGDAAAIAGQARPGGRLQIHASALADVSSKKAERQVCRIAQRWLRTLMCSDLTSEIEPGRRRSAHGLVQSPTHRRASRVPCTEIVRGALDSAAFLKTPSKG